MDISNCFVFVWIYFVLISLRVEISINLPMGSSTSKFRKALQRGEGVEAMHIYLKNPDIKRNLDPNYSFGVNHGHNTALHFAAMHAMKAFIREFLEERANPNIRNGAGQNALHCICSTYQRGETSVDKARAECLSNLLGWNANLQEGTAIEIDARDEVGVFLLT